MREDALAIESDPVVELEDDVLTWRVPLHPETVGSDHEITLNEFLAELRVLNHPYKWLSFKDPLGNYYALKDGIVVVTDEGLRRIYGNAPLRIAFEIVGYNPDTYLQQIHGIKPSLKIDTNLVNIPSWMFSVEEFDKIQF